MEITNTGATDTPEPITKDKDKTITVDVKVADKAGTTTEATGGNGATASCGAMAAVWDAGGWFGCHTALFPSRCGASPDNALRDAGPVAWDEGPHLWENLGQI